MRPLMIGLGLVLLTPFTQATHYMSCAGYCRWKAGMTLTRAEAAAQVWAKHVQVAAEMQEVM